MALRVGLPAVAVVVAFTISLVVALSSSAAPASPSARPTIPLHPQPPVAKVLAGADQMLTIPGRSRASQGR